MLSIAFETIEYFLKTHELLRLAFFFWLLSHLLCVFLLNSRPKMLVQSFSHSLHTFYQLHGFSYSMLMILKYFSDLQELVSSKTTAIFLCNLCLYLHAHWLLSLNIHIQEENYFSCVPHFGVHQQYLQAEAYSHLPFHPLLHPPHSIISHVPTILVLNISNPTFSAVRLSSSPVPS